MSSDSSFLDIARKTGVEIIERDGLIFWQGPASGKKKPQGPLTGKRVGIIVASEFSDFQAYYLALYLTEFGAEVDFLGVDWVKWKNTRPTLSDKGVQGMWGLSLDPIPTMSRGRQGYKPFREARKEDYDGLIVLGGHSADILQTQSEVTEFLSLAYERGAVLGAIGGGSLPLINGGIINGKRCTGNRVVAFMLRKIARFEDLPVVSDQRIVTARDTVDTPAFLTLLCQQFDPSFQPERKGALDGKKILIIAGEDFEDVELVAPVLEYLYRGAELTLATFPPPLRARPPLLGVNVVLGNFGVSVPLQEIPDSCYTLKKLSEVSMGDFDLVQIPGAFCPWNMVASGEPIEFLKEAYKAGKLIAPICHGAIPVAAADLVVGRHLAGVGACYDAVTIMGGEHSGDWSAVIDGPIVSGRVPVDVPEFLDAVSTALSRR
jgi:protease I